MSEGAGLSPASAGMGGRGLLVLKVRPHPYILMTLMRLEFVAVKCFDLSVFFIDVDDCDPHPW